ncbi:DNA topology modulation protein FlaR [uncultured Tateyamaria sp.]|uniref:DNA topology modulation protein FlaR n=1 Tax=uncultured Tateyamaria sp. TaxID=455651 RepID=UPI002629DAD2|nr:DNA topology modulation protein FlaR [uncultured Tateyamaria sp.]
MKKIIITGANGVGKSHFAKRLALVRPDVPVVSFDAIKLRTGWRKRPRFETDAALASKLEQDAWILEGGPSLLAQAVAKADALVWLDPPEHVRGWQLATRPWKHCGRTRPELPPGNVDWPWQQYRFALRSLRNRSKFHSYISEVFRNADGLKKWRCRDESDRIAVVHAWSDDSG